MKDKLLTGIVIAGMFGVFMTILHLTISTSGEKVKSVSENYSEIEEETEFVRLTSADRENNGKLPLNIDERLMLSADEKAEDMIEKKYFEHISPDGTTPWYFIQSAGYNYSYAGENIAMDFSTLEGAERGFMNSDGHRKIILSDRYADIGVSVKRDNGKYVVVVHFGKPY